LFKSNNPDPITRDFAQALSHSETLRFDLSDLQPPAFAATAGQGRWDMFQRYLSGARSIERTMHHLKRGSGQARRCERANAGIC